MNREHLEQLADDLIDALREDRQIAGWAPRERGRAAIEPTPAPGQLWHVAPASGALPALFYVTHSSPDRPRNMSSQGYLVHDNTWLAATDDLVLDPYESPTGRPLVICTWQPLHVDTGAFVEYIDAFSDTVQAAVEVLATSRPDAPPWPVGHDMLDDTPVVEWELVHPDGSELRYLTGARILSDDDPRRRARAALVDATAPTRASNDDGLDTFATPLQRLFARLRDAAARQAEPALPPPVLHSAFPVLDFGADASMRRSEGSHKGLNHEFSLVCGEVTATLCVSDGPSGITLDVYAEAGGRDFAHLQVRWLQGANDGFELLWQGETDAHGLAQSPPLPLRPEEVHRIEIEARGASTMLEF